ncbi:hypothetical protein [Herbidospora solisilvae]|nr:hypothetical protein [Herbidospora solisilvae]
MTEPDVDPFDPVYFCTMCQWTTEDPGETECDCEDGIPRTW